MVVYQWVEWLRDFLEKKDQLKAQAQLQAQLKAQLEAGELWSCNHVI